MLFLENLRIKDGNIRNKGIAQFISTLILILGPSITPQKNLAALVGKVSITEQKQAKGR